MSFPEKYRQLFSRLVRNGVTKQGCMVCLLFQQGLGFFYGARNVHLYAVQSENGLAKQREFEVGA